MNLVHLDMSFSCIEETPDFSHMPNLEVLNLCRSSKLVHVHPSLGDHMKVRCINLEYCKELEEFPNINQMTSLEILNLSYTSLQCFPEIYGNLDSLKILKLRKTSIEGLPSLIVGIAAGLQKLRFECRYQPLKEFQSLEVVEESFPGLVSLKITGSGIVRTLDFSHLPYLEKLDLSYSIDLVEVHASLGVHKRIRSIDLKNCSKLEEFPRIVDMNSLEELNLSRTSLQRFPEITGNLNRLVKLYLDDTDIPALPWSIGRATGLEIISLQRCKYMLALPISFLGLHQFQRIYISSGKLKYFKEYIDYEADVLHEVELHSPQRKRQKQLIGSQGTGQLSGVQITFRNCKSLEELPDFLLSRVKVLVITECPTLVGWICFNLVDLLEKYQHFCYLQLHEKYGIVPYEFLQAFSEWESMSNMLRKRENCFNVHVPVRQIPSWFQYQSSRRSVTMILPPLSEWYTDKFRGFVLSGINATLSNIYVLSTSNYTDHCVNCCCPEELHVSVMYIPVDDIRGALRDRDEQKEYTLFDLSSRRCRGKEMEETCPRWGFSLVYSEGEVNKVDPHQVIVVTDDCRDSIPYFRVKVAKNRDMIEKLYCSNDHISFSILQAAITLVGMKSGFGIRENDELCIDDYQCNDDSNNHIERTLL